MDQTQARHLVQLHDLADRALANLRNANAMAVDDPRAAELLEEAGDAYAESITALDDEQRAVIAARQRGDLTPVADLPADAEPAASANGRSGPEFAPGTAAWIVTEGTGTGFVADRDDVTEGFVPLRLTSDATYKGDNYPEGATIAVAVSDLSSTDPAGAASGAETAGAGSGEGQGTPSA